MKIFLFNVLMLFGLHAFAAQPLGEAPSEELIARSAFRDMHMSVSEVVVNELENLLSISPNRKELFFNYQNVTYNCVITFPAHIFFNPEMNGFSVGRIDISECENYATGESAQPVTINQMRLSAFFGEGVIFTDNNTGFRPNPYARAVSNSRR